jgi:hypothetical protein
MFTGAAFFSAASAATQVPFCPYGAACGYASLLFYLALILNYDPCDSPKYGWAFDGAGGGSRTRDVYRVGVSF